MGYKGVNKIILNEQTYCIGDRIKLYFVEHVEEVKSKGRRVVEREFTISDIYRKIITVQDCFGFKTSFSHWEFAKRLNKPETKFKSNGDRMFLFANGCSL